MVGFQNGHHAIIKDGVVVIEGDRILHVGRSFDGQVDQTIDACGKLVSPGFINIHGVANLDIQTLALDSRGSAFTSPKAYAVDGTGEGQLTFAGERLETSVLFSLVQFLKGGATTIVEITAMGGARFEVSRDEAPTLAETAGKLGARIYVSHKFRAGKKYTSEKGGSEYHWDLDAARAGLEYSKEIVRRYEGAYNDRVRTMFFPYQFDAFPPGLLREVKQTAREMNVPVHMHTSQYLWEFHLTLQRYGKTPVQLLREIDFLDPQTIVTHMIYTSDHPQSGFARGDKSDLKILADSGANVAHEPVVYIRRGFLLGSFSRYLTAGINVCIGTDTFPQDMIKEMRWAALGCKWIDRNANHGTAREVFNAVTLNGAKALGRDDLGRLAPGAKADLLIVDFTRQHIGPVNEPIKTLVYAAKGTDIETVFVDGQVVVEGGKVRGVDEDQLVQRATEAHLWHKGQFAALHPSGKPEAELFPSTYPVR